MPQSNSEVARLMAQITLEYEAAQRALNDPAMGAAQHEFITARMENMGRNSAQLRDLLGYDEGMTLTCKAIEGAGQEQALPDPS